MTKRSRIGQGVPHARQQTFSFLEGPAGGPLAAGATDPGTAAASGADGFDSAGTSGRPWAAEAWPLDGGILAEGDSFLGELEAASALEELDRVARGCRRCPLREGCRGVVFGEGDPRAVMMFVGEGPGQTEDEMGRPFVGRAGQLLDRWIGLLGLKRQQVYITNVVKCRPPGNRTPLAEEMRSCWPILRHQIRLIRPRILVCLGSPALQALVHPGARITRLRGSWLERGGIRILGTFHPAAVLRDPTKERAVHEDLRRLRAEYLRIAPRGGD
ncbi:MAG: uracil-DNA glycosylase [Bacillota bacterium]